MHALLGDFGHDLFGGARLVYDCYEVFCESKWNVVYRVLEDVVHYVSESVYQVVAAEDEGLLLIDKLCADWLLRGLSLVLGACGRDDFVEQDEGIYSLKKITLSELLNV